MKESRQYINFLKNNCWIIFTPPVLFFIIAYFYLQSLPERFIYSADYYSIKESSQDRALDVEHAIYFLRSSNNRQNLNLREDDFINAYKTGPYGLTVEISSVSNENLNTVKDRISSTLLDKSHFSRSGETIFKNNQNRLIYAAVFTCCGLLLGLVFSLLKEYLKKY